MKKHLLTLLKVVLPLAIVVWLLASIEPHELASLRDRPKHWGMLLAAFGVVLLTVLLTFVRWFLLVRMLHIPFRLRDAFRLSFLGYLFNFVGVGSVGGDLFKAYFIAKEQPHRRAEAVATVVVDRIVGLYALLVLTSLTILISGIPSSPMALQAICQATLLATVVAGLIVLLILVPGFTTGSFAELLINLPRIGSTLGKLIKSLRMFRAQVVLMLGILGMSMAVHGLLAVAFYLIASGLFGQAPTLGEHLIIVPLSNVAGAIPFMPGGLGTFEYAMEELYNYVPADGPGDVIGVLVALSYRLITIAIAAIGVVYYWISRREVQQVLAAAERSRDDDATQQ